MLSMIDWFLSVPDGTTPPLLRKIDPGVATFVRQKEAELSPQPSDAA
jgi:hypothetical protein